MKSTKNKILIVLVCLLLSGFNPLMACGCYHIITIDESPLSFAGRVTKIEEVPYNKGYSYKITFAVQDIIHCVKLESPNTSDKIEIWVDSFVEGACGYNFIVGFSYELSTSFIENVGYTTGFCHFIRAVY